MAKATTIKIKLLSTADTGFFYVTTKNSRTMTDKMTKTKYDRSPRSMLSSRKRRSSKICVQAFKKGAILMGRAFFVVQFSVGSQRGRTPSFSHPTTQKAPLSSSTAVPL